MNQPSPTYVAELLALAGEHAPKLRDAGVRGRVDVAGVLSFEVGPSERAEPAAHVEQEPGDPLNDPATFGLPPGSQVPSSRSGGGQ